MCITKLSDRDRYWAESIVYVFANEDVGRRGGTLAELVGFRVAQAREYSDEAEIFDLGVLTTVWEKSDLPYY